MKRSYHFLKIIGFFAVLLGNLLLLGPFLEPKNNYLKDGLYYPEAMGILGEPENSIDVLMIGDSEVCAALSPMELWQKTGITSYACSSTDQQLFETQAIASMVLKYQKPKVVFIETNVFYRSMNRLDAAMAALREALPAVKYHDRWKNLQVRDLNPRKSYDSTSIQRGFYHTRKVEPADTSKYMKPNTAVNRPAALNEKLIRALVKTFTDAGAQVIFVTTPNTRNWDTTRSNGMQALSRDMGIAYIDMNSLQEEIAIDWQTDTRDAGDHLNTGGAEKVMAYLNRYITENFDLPDRRNDPAFARWNEDLKAYLQLKSE